MRKLSVILALVLCAVLCVFCFAACGKKSGAEETTANETTPAATDAKTDAATEAETEAKTEAATEAETEAGTEAGTEAKTEAATESETETEPAFVCHHIPDDNYTVIPATCIETGLKYKFCVECGEIVESTIEELPIDEDAHKVDNWTVTKQPTLLDPTGSRNGDCSLCHSHVEQETVFEHNVQVFTTSSGKYTPGYATLAEIRGENHFYPTDDNLEGNDLLVEYSVLWNETLLNLDVSNNRMPTIDTRFATSASGSSGNSGIVRWELASDTTSQWCTCKFAGGFEVAAFDTSEPDNPYPKFAQTEDVDVTSYPNIGGANLGDGQPHGDTQWGWHRVSIRYREEVTNLDDVKDGAEATYKLQVWVFVDGVMILHYSGPDHKWGGDGSDRKLYSVKSDGDGGVIYTENDHLYLHGAFLDSIKMREGKGYFEIADYSVTIGEDFVQNVRKVATPVPTTMEVKDGATVPSTMWYELAD